MHIKSLSLSQYETLIAFLCLLDISKKSNEERINILYVVAIIITQRISYLIEKKRSN